MGIRDQIVQKGTDAVERIKQLPEERRQKIEAGAEDIMAAMRPKQRISIWLDKETLEFLKGKGPRYQTRINAILRKYMMENR